MLMSFRPKIYISKHLGTDLCSLLLCLKHGFGGLGECIIMLIHYLLVTVIQLFWNFNGIYLLDESIRKIARAERLSKCFTCNISLESLANIFKWKNLGKLAEKFTLCSTDTIFSQEW